MPQKSKPTLESLAADIERLQRALDPQTIRNALERTYDPKGGEPRIIDENGRTLDYTPNIQLLGGTTTLDAPNQRIIYTATGGGGGGLEAEFSDDATTTDTERIKYVWQSDATKNRWTFDSTTSGANRRGTQKVAENTASSTLYAQSWLQAGEDDDTNPQASFYTGAIGDSVDSSNVSGEARTFSGNARLSASDGTNFALVEVNHDSSAGTKSSVLASATQGANACTTSIFPTFIQLITGGTTRTLMSGSTGVSHFMQTTVSGTAPGTAVMRVTRTAFSAAPGSIAAGGTAAVTVSSALYGTATNQVVFGHVQGAAGMELVLWSWVAGPGANQVTINFTNTSGGALTPVLQFATICDA